jgi:hypothetical protein
MIEHKYVVIEYYESDHGGKPGDKHNSLAIHRVEDGEIQASDDGSPVTREEALEMLAAFDRPIHASVDVAEEDEELRNITEYDGDSAPDLEFLKAKADAESIIKLMSITNVLNLIPLVKYVELESKILNGPTWSMLVVSVKIDGTKHRDELLKMGLTNIAKPKLWVECNIYKTGSEAHLIFWFFHLNFSTI